MDHYLGEQFSAVARLALWTWHLSFRYVSYAPYYAKLVKLICMAISLFQVVGALFRC
jgi:hypothetical protein